LINTSKKYKSLFIVENKNHWDSEAIHFDTSTDCLLTFDFALKLAIEKLGGEAFYIDSICSPPELQKNNFIASDFFKKWHLDCHGNDIFTSQGVPFGFSFRILIWSEYLYYVRLRANLEKIRQVEYTNIYLAESGSLLSNILKKMNMPFIHLKLPTKNNETYYFDIHQYLHNALHGFNWHNVARNVLVKVFSITSYYIDSIFLKKRTKKNVYAQIYHPTAKIVDFLKKDPSIKVITSSLSKSNNWRSYLAQRLIPIRGKKSQFQKEADSLLGKLEANKCASLVLADGTDITQGAYNVIEKEIQGRVAEAIHILHSVVTYFKKQPVDLEIMIANLGMVQTIVDCVLKEKNTPRYLIINGILGGKFLDEGKYATYFNSYSHSIKSDYYNDAENVVCLGDPRMDSYINNDKPREINRLKPTITIGTSGFGSLNLISYVAVEFEFMFDVLTAFQEISDGGDAFRLVIKVRPNGFLNQYKNFVKQYFPNLSIDVVREVPMKEVLLKTDLYISIYSQTLFEASCLGIPAIYYKKDKEVLYPPFDKKSELVTVDTVHDLKIAFSDFKTKHQRFDAFLEKQVMEKYIGPLDGQNLERNLDFIYDLMSHPMRKKG